MKFLADKKCCYQTDKVHDDFELLKVADIANHEILTFVYNYFAGNLPPVFHNYYRTFAEFHSINTRNADTHIRQINRNSNIGAVSVKVKGATLWNSIDNEIRNSINTKQFRSNHKKSLFPYDRNV